VQNSNNETVTLTQEAPTVLLTTEQLLLLRLQGWDANRDDLEQILPVDLYPRRPLESNMENAVESGENSENSTAVNCLDDESYVFTASAADESNNLNMTCSDIGNFADILRKGLCDIIEIYQKCPEGCGRCCRDDPDYFIYTSFIQNEIQNCSWISEDESRPGHWCNSVNNGRLISDGCPVSCNACRVHMTQEPTMSPSISLSPTNAPSTTSAPSSSPSDTPTMTPTFSPSTSSKPSSNPSGTPSKAPSTSPSDKPTPEKKPNLIFILTDEHNFRTLGCYRKYMRSIGNPDIVWGHGNYVYTPNIDKLASEGALFSNFYAVTPLCTPSRASFMSGLHPAFTGDSDNNHGSMDDHITTFASILRDQEGYFTSYFGKWHLGGEASPGWYDPGRDFGFTNTRYRYNRGHWKYFEASTDSYKVQEYTIDGEGDFSGNLDKHYATDFLFDRSIEDIQTALDADKNFAMVLSIADPHGPNNVRPPYRTMFNNMKVKYPDSGKAAVQGIGNPRWNNVDHETIDPNDAAAYIEDYENDSYFQNYMQQYYAMVALIDANVGKLLSFIETKGIDEETIIVFSSDHGDLLGEHGKMNKGRPYETSAGIPFIVRYPEKIQNGKIIQNAYSSVDFAPTILKLMGVDHPGVTFQGVDATPEIFNSDKLVTDGDRITFTYDNENTAVWAAAVMSGYKLVVSRPDVPWLFHYSKDPDELINYFEDPQYAGVVEKLQAALFDGMQKYSVPLAKKADVFFWDMPACMDSAEVVELRSGRKIMCTDIIEDDEQSRNRCSRQNEVRTKCARACNRCTCEDSPGRLFVSGELKMCNQLSAQCGHSRVRQFCPSTCNAC